MNHPCRAVSIEERKKRGKLNTSSSSIKNDSLIVEVVNGVTNASYHDKNYSTSDSTNYPINVIK